MMLKSVLRFVFDNIGNPLSSKKIADMMTSEGRKIDTKTVGKYLEAFSESYIIYQAKRYNIKGKQYLKTLGKYYIVDIGMRYTLLRELRPLQAIRDHYPKIILTMDEEPEEQYEGIRRINARDWLLGIVD